jgi:hypothetical protein
MPCIALYRGRGAGGVEGYAPRSEGGKDGFKEPGEEAVSKCMDIIR